MSFPNRGALRAALSVVRRVSIASMFAAPLFVSFAANAAPAAKPAPPAAATKPPAIDVARAENLARANACVSCHAASRRLVGPSYEDVAARYKTDPAAETKLMDKIKKGGSGVWGVIPMPAHPRMADADSRLLAQWVLQGAPASH
ncbi:cytochrome c [Chitinasiproducens palmae]|uniref:Cytochrome c n=1 Tax=Chitinasiproducens palmae TaxID=1770053 RepID=A0A1H2PPE7_9BURK|nr:cytochrome c [Chitinasiproducens palmae]